MKFNLSVNKYQVIFYLDRHLKLSESNDASLHRSTTTVAKSCTMWKFKGSFAFALLYRNKTHLICVEPSMLFDSP